MLLILVALVAVSFVPTQSSPLFCAPHDRMAAFLRSEHGEMLSGYGSDPRGLLLELYSDPQDGSWTVTLTGADGKACIVSWGTAWQDEKGWPA